MKVLHVLDHSIPLHSGYTFRTANILREQRALGWQTCHVTGLKHSEEASAEGIVPAQETVDGLHFFRTERGLSPLEKLPVLNQWQVVRSLEQRLLQVIQQEQPDVLHAHSPALNGLAALAAGRRAGLPVVYECRAFWEDAAVDHGTSSEGGVRYRLTRALETRVFRQADAVTTICEGLRSDILSRGVAAERVTVIPNGVDVSGFVAGLAPDPALALALGLGDCTVLGFIGSFYAYEGLPLLVDALPAILAQVPNARLLLVGGGPDESRIRQRARELSVEHALVMPGRVPHAEVERYYALCDLMVYPRLNMRLTDLVTPLKPLEAMAQEKLVVASDVGGHKELIADGETGSLFAAGSADALSQKVVDLLNTPERWPQMRTAGREYVEQQRSWKISVSRYESVYDALDLPVAGQGE